MYNPLMWECPGGHVDFDCGDVDNLSTRVEALRELKEEVGIIAPPEALIALPKVGTHQPYVLNLNSQIPPTVTLSPEHDRFKWHSIVAKVVNSPMRKEVYVFIHQNKKRMLR
jgi:8-oxo-dGTP pyrophosphatase MutT (NUDIX family)